MDALMCVALFVIVGKLDAIEMIGWVYRFSHIRCVVITMLVHSFRTRLDIQT